MNPHDDPDLLRELAERATGAMLYPGALPPGLPFDVPVPPTGRLLGSTVTTPPPLSRGWRQAMERGKAVPASRLSDKVAIFLHVDASPRDVRALFDQTFEQQGWADVGLAYRTAWDEIPDRALGALYRNERQQQIESWFSETDESFTEVTFRFDTAPFEEEQPRQPSDLDLIPTIQNTETFRIQSMRSSAYDDRVTSEGDATTDRTLGDVSRAISEQLTRASWTARESGSGNSIAYTVWDVPHDPPARGWAIVISGIHPRTMYYQITIAWDAGDGRDTDSFGSSY